MNKAQKLFDPNYIRDYFTENILPLYPQFLGIKKVKIIPHKKLMWEDVAYHIVCEYEVSFIEEIDNSIKIKKIAIFCDGDFWHANPKKYNKKVHPERQAGCSCYTDDGINDRESQSHAGGGN
jgi:hypothetical protein